MAQQEQKLFGINWNRRRGKELAHLHLLWVSSNFKCFFISQRQCRCSFKYGLRGCLFVEALPSLLSKLGFYFTFWLNCNCKQTELISEYNVLIIKKRNITKHIFFLLFIGEFTTCNVGQQDQMQLVKCLLEWKCSDESTAEVQLEGEKSATHLIPIWLKSGSRDCTAVLIVRVFTLFILMANITSFTTSFCHSCCEGQREGRLYPPMAFTLKKTQAYFELYYFILFAISLTSQVLPTKSLPPLHQFSPFTHLKTLFC